jgi:hypothetical protein
MKIKSKDDHIRSRTKGKVTSFEHSDKKVSGDILYVRYDVDNELMNTTRACSALLDVMEKANTMYNFSNGFTSERLLESISSINNQRLSCEESDFHSSIIKQSTSKTKSTLTKLLSNDESIISAFRQYNCIEVVSVFLPKFLIFFSESTELVDKMNTLFPVLDTLTVKMFFILGLLSKVAAHAIIDSKNKERDLLDFTNANDLRFGDSFMEDLNPKNIIDKLFNPEDGVISDTVVIDCMLYFFALSRSTNDILTLLGGL